MSEHAPVAYWIVPPFPAAQNWRVEFDRAEADRLAKGNFIVRPLYEHPQPTLTDAEREAIEYFAGVHCRPSDSHDGHIATLLGLLGRTK